MLAVKQAVRQVKLLPLQKQFTRGRRGEKKREGKETGRGKERKNEREIEIDRSIYR